MVADASTTVEVTLSEARGAAKTPASEEDDTTEWTKTANVFEYGAAANPVMAPIPVLVHPPRPFTRPATRA